MLRIKILYIASIVFGSILGLIALCLFICWLTNMLVNSRTAYNISHKCVKYILPAMAISAIAFMLTMCGYTYQTRYRTHSKPTLEDVMAGNAELCVYNIVPIDDTVPVHDYYEVHWCGTNQSYERNINNIEETFIYNKNNKNK